MLIIVYASLQPFAGWRMPPPEVLAFLTAPWPRYITATDIALNVAAYLPLGIMLYCAVRPPLAPAIACVLAVLLAAALSLALESVQMFLPTRIASNVDLLSNSAGAAVGALVLTLTNNPFAAMRGRVVRTGKLGECGLIVITLWVVIQLHPSPLAFGSGNVRDAFGIAPRFMHTSQSYLLAEAAVVALAVIAVGLIVTLLVSARRYALRALILTLLATIAAKSIAALAIARAANALQWLTPGVAMGFVAGAAGVALLVWLAPPARAVFAIVCCGERCHRQYHTGQSVSDTAGGAGGAAADPSCQFRRHCAHSRAALAARRVPAARGIRAREALATRPAKAPCP